MSEHKRERRYKFTVTLPPRKPRKPLSPKTKRVLKEIWYWVLVFLWLGVAGGILGWLIVAPVIDKVIKWVFVNT